VFFRSYSFEVTDSHCFALSVYSLNLSLKLNLSLSHSSSSLSISHIPLRHSLSLVVPLPHSHSALPFLQGFTLFSVLHLRPSCSLGQTTTATCVCVSLLLLRACVPLLCALSHSLGGKISSIVQTLQFVIVFIYNFYFSHLNLGLVFFLVGDYCDLIFYD